MNSHIFNIWLHPAPRTNLLVVIVGLVALVFSGGQIAWYRQDRCDIQDCLYNNVCVCMVVCVCKRVRFFRTVSHQEFGAVRLSGATYETCVYSLLYVAQWWLLGFGDDLWCCAMRVQFNLFQNKFPGLQWVTHLRDYVIFFRFHIDKHHKGIYIIVLLLVCVCVCVDSAHNNVCLQWINFVTIVNPTHPSAWPTLALYVYVYT